MKNNKLAIAISSLLFLFTLAAKADYYSPECGPSNNNCSPDHPAQVYYECALNFSGFVGNIEQAPSAVDSLQTCVLVAASRVQQCFEGGSEPQIQAFHDNIYTSLIFSRSGERLYWDFYVGSTTSYDSYGNIVVTYTVFKANPSDLRPTN